MRHNPDTTGRKPPTGLVVLHYYADDGNAQMDRWAEKAWKIALASPIRILSDRELTAVAVIGNKVVGGGWSAVEHPFSDDAEGTFTFDIVVDPKSQGKGVGDALVEEMLNQFRSVRDMGDAEYVLDVEVVNPAMERILARRGFRLRDEEDPRAVRGKTMMTRPNGRPVPRRNGRPVLRPNPRRNGQRRNPEMSVQEIERELLFTGAPTTVSYDQEAYERARSGVMRLRGANLRGADLRGIDFRGDDLRYANLSYANLSGVRLDGAVLASANLEGADLTGASLKDASLEDVQLSEANLTEANCEGATFAEGRLWNANFSRANLRKANLLRVDAGETNFEGADLEDANLGKAYLQGANFRGARLRNARLTSLRGEIDDAGEFGGLSAKFLRADLMGADLQGSRFIHANFTDADLTKADLTDTTFTECSFVDADLTRANLRDARFENCVMRGAVGTPADRVRDPRASLVGLDFAGVALRGANFSGREVWGARFASADLTGASFVGCHLAGCDFKSTVLSLADFTQSTAERANFTRASARGANFTEARLDGADFSDALVPEANFSGADLRYASLNRVGAVGANFERVIFVEGKALRGNFSLARFNGAHLREVDFSGAHLPKADFSGAELRTVTFERADLLGATFTDAVLENISVSTAAMDSATRALFFAPRSAYGKMSGPILKMDKPDAPMKAAEFKKTYPREFERLKADTGGKDFVPAIKDAIRAKYRSARPWIVTQGRYTSDTQRWCSTPNNVLKFNIALDDATFTPAQQDSLRKLAETSRHSGHPHERGDLFTVGWVRYCTDNKQPVWVVEEIQSDVSVVRQQLKDEERFPAEFREVVDILAPIAERFYYDALGVVFEMAAEKGYEVEMLDYLAKKDMGSPRSVYTDLPREMGMQKRPASNLQANAIAESIGSVWWYKPNPHRNKRRS